MSVFDDTDPTGTISFPEIRKTGANTVRIVWAITQDLQRNGPVTSASTLDALITNARANGLVPMIELHDATGNWGRLGDLVAYWTQQPIVNIIKKHQNYLLVNIGNEVGDENVSDAQFLAGYTGAVQQMRQAGIHTPLVIDAPDWGKKLTTLTATAASLLAADPDHNLIFSAHLYWGIANGANAQFIRTALADAVAANYPLIVGEFSRHGAYDPNGGSICGPGGETDYRTILEECHKHGIGWYAWEWGPGNDFFDPLCASMDMTPDRMFASLKTGWAKEVALTSPFSIKNTAQSIPDPGMVAPPDTGKRKSRKKKRKKGKRGGGRRK
jgi:mannan endo-1,4-beta-mannosidase